MDTPTEATSSPSPLTCRIVRGDTSYQGKQGLTYFSGISAEMWYGPQLEHHLVQHAGEFLYIPANMPHLPFNPYAEEAVALLARTDPNEQESVTLLPDLEQRYRPAR